MIAASLIFGSIGIVARFIDFPSAPTVQLRAIFGAVFLLCVMIYKRKPLHWGNVRKNALWLVLSGISLGANWAFMFEAYRYIPVSMAVIICYFAPIIVFFAAPFLFKERLYSVQIAGILAAVVGMILVNLPSLQGSGFSIGIGYAFAGAVLYAGTMIINRYMRDIDSLDSTFVQLFVAALVMTPYSYLATGTPFLLPDLYNLSLIALLGIAHTGIAFLLFFSALQRVPTQESSIMSYIDPASSIIYAMIIFGEMLSFVQVIGVLLIFGGTLFAQLMTKQIPTPRIPE